MCFVLRTAHGCMRHSKPHWQWPHIPAGSVTTPWVCSCTQNTWASPSPRALGQVPWALPASQGVIFNQCVWIHLSIRAASPELTPGKAASLNSLLAGNLFNKDHLAPRGSRSSASGSPGEKVCKMSSPEWLSSSKKKLQNSLHAAINETAPLFENSRLALVHLEIWSWKACTLELLFPQAFLKMQSVYSFSGKISFFRAPSVEKQKEKT